VLFPIARLAGSMRDGAISRLVPNQRLEQQRPLVLPKGDAFVYISGA